MINTVPKFTWEFKLFCSGEIYKQDKIDISREQSYKIFQVLRQFNQVLQIKSVNPKKEVPTKKSKSVSSKGKITRAKKRVSTSKPKSVKARKLTVKKSPLEKITLIDNKLIDEIDNLFDF